jgi:nitrite reductase (NO-forming)
MQMAAKRAAMLGFAMLLIAMPSLAQDAPRLSRQKVELLAPPFVHSHQHATTEGPKLLNSAL